MTDTDDFFAPDGPERDGYGRPLLFPRGGEVKVPYTRASSLADIIGDFSFLWKWKMRYLARSLGQNADLAALAGVECYTTGFDRGTEAVNRASGKRLDDIIVRALDRGGISVKADYGSVVHALTEPGNDGHVEYENAEADTASFWAKCQELGIKILGTELFTANDTLMSAGTFDHLMWVPGVGIVITDKKTSKEVHGADFRIQLASYATSDLYDWETDERQTLEDYVISIGWDPSLINRDVGYIIWIKNGKTEFHRLDLEAGFEAAKVAAWVRDNHRRGKHSWPADDDIFVALNRGKASLVNLIAQAESIETLNALWDTQDVQALWTPQATAAAVKRKAELT